jgi:hypothetical protein
MPDPVVMRSFEGISDLPGNGERFVLQKLNRTANESAGGLGQAR